MHKKFLLTLVFIVGLPFLLMSPTPTIAMIKQDEESKNTTPISKPKPTGNWQQDWENNYGLTTNPTIKVLNQIINDPLIDPREIGKLNDSHKK